ncbi:hypothetical protein [Methanobacterium alcaliphilum]|uniref:hypothetical protein n=1 Tax=Methanobacterium alcaliphilum TaxID=392018 RepID=UPI00200B39EA|nr:hypothetical protein [Methanobacterium alcaliphilum]MCK9152167.1 hypothetical protein [Methanobacterium alcaliphilum]
MSKSFDILMAGVISGIVAFTTTQLGIGGTVIGAVLGSMLYQLMSHYIKEPLGRVRTQKVETRLVYVFPLLIILGIELIYILMPLHYKWVQIFYLLEGATGWNLFRFIGIGLILMGVLPIIQSENIKRTYGYILSSVGIVVLLRGLLDINSPLVKLYSKLFSQFDFLISLMAILALSFVILSLFGEAIAIIREKKKEEPEKINGDNSDIERESGND